MTSKKQAPEPEVDEDAQDAEEAVAEQPVDEPPPPPPEPLVSPTPTDAPTPPQYAVGAVKQQPEGLAVAIRTNILDPNGLKDWGIMTVDRGGHYGGYEEVANWTDLT